MDRLKYMKDSLMCIVESQMGNLQNVDTKELGEAVDMIKDLSEAIYYCTITEAMNKEDKEKSNGNGHAMYYTEPVVYVRDARGTNQSENNGRRYMMDDGMYNYAGEGGGTRYMMDYNYANDTGSMRDAREGRSGRSRKMYMESKHSHADKASQLRELEKYMQELAQDITEMIEDATPEEKQYLEKKITALASKVGQMK